jgi:excisionase family DNA binding protein
MDAQFHHENILFLTPGQCAAQLQLSRWTIYHWIGDGKLAESHGLRRIGRRWLIEWSVLKAAIDRGDLS